MEKSWPIIVFLAILAFILIPHNVKVEIAESQAEAKIENVVKQSNQVFSAILRRLQEHDKALGLDKKKEEVK